MPFQQCGPSRGASFAKSYICLSCTFFSLCLPFHIALRGLTAWLVSSFQLLPPALCFACTCGHLRGTVQCFPWRIICRHRCSTTTVVNYFFMSLINCDHGVVTVINDTLNRYDKKGDGLSNIASSTCLYSKIKVVHTDTSECKLSSIGRTFWLT